MIEIVYRPLVIFPQPFTDPRAESRFKAKYNHTIEQLSAELEKLDATDVVIQAAFREWDIRRDGMPRSDAREPEHPGVVIAFNSRYGPLQYVTDAFSHWKANIRAIALGLEALRTVDRYGITKRGEQYTGWRALPPAGGSTVVVGPVRTREWALGVIRKHVGGFYSQADLLAGGDVLDRAVRSARRLAHPDQGGSSSAFAEVEAARQILVGAGG